MINERKPDGERKIHPGPIRPALRMFEEERGGKTAADVIAEQAPAMAVIAEVEYCDLHKDCSQSRTPGVQDVDTSF